MRSQRQELPRYETHNIDINMLCDTCIGLLHKNKGLTWQRTLAQTFDHHKSTKTLRRSAKAGCSICTAIAKELEPEINLKETQPLLLQAVLDRKKKRGEKTWFRLDFSLIGRLRCTFILAETSRWMAELVPLQIC